MFELFTNTDDYYGKVIFADRLLYRHYGIGVGDRRVIHFDGDTEDNARVVETSLDSFSAGNSINICYRVSPKYSREDMMH
jgi:Lecithin retinol acyltransferase